MDRRTRRVFGNNRTISDAGSDVRREFDCLAKQAIDASGTIMDDTIVINKICSNAFYYVE
jgi:hypothetical protein